MQNYFKERYKLTKKCCFPAVNLVGCGPDKPLVVQENTQNYTIVCEDVRSDNDVRWVLTRTTSNRTGTNVGDCTGNSLVCAGGNPLISFSRPSRNLSIVQITKVDRSMFGMANVTCSGIPQTGELVVISSSCNIDVICKYLILYMLLCAYVCVTFLIFHTWKKFSFLLLIV